MVLLSAHYDSYFSGFQDDNTAVAMELELPGTFEEWCKPKIPIVSVPWRRRNGG